jgi:hypothetical protein
MLQTRTFTTALSLVLLLGACSTRSDHAAPLSDDLKQDLAAAAPSAGDLATTPPSFQPMRFVSAVERVHTAAPAKRTAMAHRRVKATHSRQPAPEVASETPDPMSTMVSEAPAPAATSEAATPEPTVIAHQPTTETTSAPSTATAGSGGEVGGGDRGHGGGWGGILGGLIGAAVIRGGIGTVDKCDPRSDGRGRPTIIDRPVFGLPVPTGQPTFPGSRRR